MTVEQEALESAVALSVRYVNDRFLPDKAIDVLDEACSKVSLRGFKVPDSIEELEQVIDHLRCDLLVIKPDQYQTPVELDDEEDD